MTRFRWLPVVLLLLSLSSGGTLADSSWETAYDENGRRFIPVHLWTGSEWDGSRSLSLPRTHLTFGHNGNKSIVGPKKWTHPGTGAVHSVYERRNRGKVQYFALTPNRHGLGRVYDNRYPRYCPDEVKFPIGWWKQGEKRTYDITCGGGRKRRIEVTITKLSFSFQGNAHSLEFHWKLNDGKKPGSNNYYTYSPERGLVQVVSN